ncbi:DUF47 domain-containing protein [Metabacillus sp. GX 13764]|uniref:DUF47 domain-containing protein n=1 Tax=Metabacillus kandeliae TaxID=2900151 RepID=UPI001E5DA7BE|nr:DUF47 domain-containing protein [Metabacillus kandeliae]MCD7035923.1 DUF47 domain-containing protein [Metabacillus kandeliae]
MVFARKKDRFFELLIDIAENTKTASQYFMDFEIKNAHDLKTFFETVKEYESIGDDYVHTIITDLNKAFITPIEREDILQLSMVLDDVLDGFEQSAALFEMYSVTSPTDHMKKFVGMLHQCTLEISAAIELLSNKKLTEIRKHAIKIKEYETNCDNLLRTAVKNLFATEKENPIKIIQYKEIYETLEEIADSCQGVANSLETIIMKNA